MLAAAVRGVNQARPHLKDAEFRPRYQAIIKAILRGSIKAPATRRRPENANSRDPKVGAHHKD